MTIGQNIQQLRSQHNMSQDELAERLGLSVQKIIFWELDKLLPTFNELIGLRQVFNITTDNLLGNCEFAKTSVNHKLKKGILLALFIASFCCLPLAMVLETTFSQNSPWSDMTEYMWLFYLPLPIPIASIVLGIIYKRKGFKATKNIVAGSIFVFLLVIYGSFTFIFSGTYSHDYSYVNQIETTINFELPDSGKINTEDWTTGSQSTTDSTHYSNVSDVYFTDESEISALDSSIKSSKLWVPSISTSLSSIIPSMYSIYSSGTEYDYFMVYNVDLKNYNTVPTTPGKYNFIFLAYDSVNHKMKIGEYTFDVVY